MDTVTSLGILAHDTLELREEKEDDKALDSDADRSRREPQEGRAFGGTMLSGISKTVKPSSEDNRYSTPEVVPRMNHCPVCTFINPDNLTICSMCGSKTE